MEYGPGPQRIHASSFRQAVLMYPGGIKTVSVPGGYLTFFTWESFREWEKEKKDDNPKG